MTSELPDALTVESELFYNISNVRTEVHELFEAFGDENTRALLFKVSVINEGYEQWWDREIFEPRDDEITSGTVPISDEVVPTEVLVIRDYDEQGSPVIRIVTNEEYERYDPEAKDPYDTDRLYTYIGQDVTIFGNGNAQHALGFASAPTRKDEIRDMPTTVPYFLNDESETGQQIGISLDDVTFDSFMDMPTGSPALATKLPGHRLITTQPYGKPESIHDRHHAVQEAAAILSLVNDGTQPEAAFSDQDLVDIVQFEDPEEIDD